MIYYFICSSACCIKINGEFVGECDCNIKSVNAPFPALIEIIPLKQSLLPVCYFANKQDDCFNENLRVYNCLEGLLFMPIFHQKASTYYKNLYHKDFEEISVYVYVDGFCKAYICNKEMAEIFTLPFTPDKITCKKNNNLIALSLLGEQKNKTIFFDISSSPRLIKIFNSNDCFFENDYISIDENYNYIVTKSMRYKYDYNFNLIDKQITKSGDIDSLSPLLYPFAFMEELLLSNNISCFLHEKLLPHKELLKDFIGKFYNFAPLFVGNEIKVLLLSDKAKVLNFCIEEGLICDLFFD